MSVPLPPNMTFCSNLENNKNEIKNNNELGIGTEGDANANEIMPEVLGTEDEEKKSDMTAETINVHLRVSESVRQLKVEQGELYNWGEESQIDDTNVKGFRLQRDWEHSDCYLTEEAKVTLKNINQGQEHHAWKVHEKSIGSECVSGFYELSTQSVAKGHRSKTAIIKEEKEKKIAIQMEHPCTTSLHPSERPGSFYIKIQSSTQEDPRGVPDNDLLIDCLSAPLDLVANSSNMTGSTGESHKALTDQFADMPLLPLNTASGEVIVFHSNSSTSETKKTLIPEFQIDMQRAHSLVTKSTLHPEDLLDLTLSSSGQSQEAFGNNEAQLDEGNMSNKIKRRNAQCLQSRNVWQQSGDRGQKKGNMPMTRKEEYDNLGAGSVVSQIIEYNPGRDQLLSKAEATTDDVIAGGTTYLEQERESRETMSKTHTVLNSKFSTPTEKEQRARSPFTADLYCTKSSSKLILKRYSSPHESIASDSEVSHIKVRSKEQSLVLANSTSVDDTIQANENKQMPGKGNFESFKPISSDQPHQETFETEVGGENMTAGTIYNQHCNESFISTSESALKNLSNTQQSKKTIMGKKPVTEAPADSHGTLINIDSSSCISAPSYPVANMNVSSQSLESDRSLKDFSSLHVSRLSPSTALPPIESMQLLNTYAKPVNKTPCSSGIPKPILQHSKTSLANRREEESIYGEKPEEVIEAKVIPKPKQVRPKIITYIRRSPQVIDQLDSTLESTGQPLRPSAYNMSLTRDQKTLYSEMKPSAVNNSSFSCDKYKPELQKPRIYTSGLMVSGIKPPGHHFSQMGEKFLQENIAEAGPVPYNLTGSGKDHFSTFQQSTKILAPTSVFRPTMVLKPHLGLGVVSRLPSAKSRITVPAQRPLLSSSNVQGQATDVNNLYCQDTSVEQKKSTISNAGRSNLLKPGQSGLRPPGYSRLPAAKLAAFGFVRSSSVSSVSSNQSNDSIQSDHGKTGNRKSNTINIISKCLNVGWF
nr:PREDICTED: microtubule-associated tumor suppressor candidate 2-like [Latimeria chalumnae]|eukprot:XP_006011986.2 PREDICTED: microtubule-associated tumor suppressor candidate 2-like [Latimeria chalumnae]